MKKRTIQLIILFASLSLIGIVVTQVFWVKSGYRLKEEQFHNRVDLGLRSVVNQLIRSSNDSVIARMATIRNAGTSCFNTPVSFTDVMDANLLDSLVRSELSWMNIHKDYVYGVFGTESRQFILGPYQGYEDELLESPHWISLECLCKVDPYQLSVFIPNQRSIILSQVLYWLILSISFLLIMVGAFTYSIRSMFQQKKLSQMKTDFVNNMTHEFKTPIATISLASEMLLKPQIHESPDKTKRYAGIIFDENLRLKNQVEQVLKIAMLDKGDFQLKFRRVDVHKILEGAVKNFSLIVKERNGKIRTCFHAGAHFIYADKVHFHNIILNLLDNANKYSPENPEITITTANQDGGILISVADKGIGISKENQKNIFRRFFRVPTGNIHNIKGFGLGLFYVKTMVQAHGGYIEIKSELNKGSRFDLYFPFKSEHLIVTEDEAEESSAQDITG
jgi:two-component system phosphate regulon sensor histidine kinase PhoR